ncbi:MAG: 4-(cytidine 5'-diphospho)-2-C-methyl-D-erythritol kinase [Paracoccaceae bacterium]|nr:4-(cytidine 5'-diphospho)-2-C-methyl-D-erythritol kinase [Paracoccaceae bacterium]
MAEGFAPAKVNLALHVTGRRADGYHLLDSLVVFAGVGDRLRAERADRLTLEVTGPRAAGVPTDATNLVLRAAATLGAGRGARIVLDKHLPAAAGIGGGSSDAATALRVLAELWGLPLPGADAVLALGADVPVCLAGQPARMRGIGERLEPLPDLPPAWLVLVNPGVGVPTGAVFQGLARRDNPPLPEPRPWPDAVALADWLREARNDLEPPARAVAPVIGEIIDRLAATDGCLLSRMSGSGATCFGLFASAAAASAAAQALRRMRPDWWVTDAPVASAQATRATT